MPQLTPANGGTKVEVSVEVKLIHVPPTKAPTKAPTQGPTLSPTQGPLQITLTAKVAFATELTSDVIASVSGAMADKVADDLEVPKDYVKAVMTKAASGVRRLLDIEYIAEITISIPVTDLAETADENDGIAGMLIVISMS